MVVVFVHNHLDAFEEDLAELAANMFGCTLAHGHLHQLKSYEAATLLRMAGLFVTLTPAKSSESDRAEVKRRLRDSIGWAAGKASLVKKNEEIWVVDSVEFDPLPED